MSKQVKSIHPKNYLELSTILLRWWLTIKYARIPSQQCQLICFMTISQQSFSFPFSLQFEKLPPKIITTLHTIWHIEGITSALNDNRTSFVIHCCISNISDIQLSTWNPQWTTKPPRIFVLVSPCCILQLPLIDLIESIKCKMNFRVQHSSSNLAPSIRWWVQCKGRRKATSEECEKRRQRLEVSVSYCALAFCS